MTSSSEPILKRKIGFWPAALSGTGIIVGAGIYALIGEVAGEAGGAAWLAFLVAAGVAGLTGASYAVMGRRVPKDSPEFNYTKAGLGNRAGFTSGWMMIWADMVSAAAVSLGFGGYFQSITGFPLILAALILIAVLSLVAWWGIQESVAITVLLTLVEIGGLFVVIALGLPHWGERSLLEAPKGPVGIWGASALVFFAYLGFDELGNLAEEMHNPQRDLPRALAFAVAMSSILYVLVAVSAVSLVGWQTLDASPAPLAEAVRAAIGPVGGAALSFIALTATANTVLLLLVSVSRSIYGMAQAEALPKMLGRIGRRHTPWVSTFLVWVFASLFLLIGDLASVAQISNFTTLSSFSMVNLSLAVIMIREFSKTDSKKGSRLRILLPVLALVSCLWLALGTGFLAIGIGLLMALSGLLVNHFFSRRLRQSKR